MVIVYITIKPYLPNSCVVDACYSIMICCLAVYGNRSAEEHWRVCQYHLI